jgi:hypothetical protein
MGMNRKMSLDWHRECIKNSSHALKVKEEELARMKEEVDRHRRMVTFYHVQLNEAMKQGKDGFDSDRFMLNKRSIYLKKGDY